MIQKLLDEDKAYYSYKTEEELEAEREEQKARGVMPHYEYEFAGMTEDERKAAIADAEAKG